MVSPSPWTPGFPPVDGRLFMLKVFHIALTSTRVHTGLWSGHELRILGASGEYVRLPDAVKVTGWLAVPPL